jgi:hypothetical protein
VYNKWQGALLDYVSYFSTQADWGFIAPAFAQESRRLNAPGHMRFKRFYTLDSERAAVIRRLVCVAAHVATNFAVNARR